jgi:glycosyltransferase involved in cell wall biosynthesis
MFESAIMINTRSCTAPLSGVQRYIREICRELAGRLQEVAPLRPLSGVVGHLWEQSILPSVVKNRLLWSPSNTGPLSLENQVVTIHDVASLDHPEWFDTRFAQWYRWLIPRLIRRVKHVITVSDFSKSRLLDISGVDESRIAVIANGVNRAFHPRSSAEVRTVLSQLKIPALYFLAVGSIEPRKNLGRLLEAWSICEPRIGNNVHLVIAGDVGQRHVFRGVELKRLPQRVHLAGFVPDEYLPALYTGSIALVYPSAYEGFGLPVAEAMASGTVPLTANSTSLPDTVGNAGILFDPCNVVEMAEAMVTVFENESLRDHLRQCALRQSERFSWEKTAARSLRVLEHAAAS